MKANITYKSVLADCNTVAERNKLFNSLDDQSKRLEIAWEALQLVLEGQISASSGSYYWSLKLHDIADTCKTSKELQKKLNKDLSDCKVCQRGLMMVSQIRLGNDISPSDTRKDDGTSRNIKGFSIEDFYEMETFYEVARKDYPFTPRTNEKLANICCNILVNGNFNPKDKTKYIEV